MAHARTYQGQPAEALTYLDEAETLDRPPPFTILYNKGHALAVRAYQMRRDDQLGWENQYTQAAEYLRQVRNEAPTYRPARTCLAVVLWEQGEEADAHAEMQYLAAVGRMSPDDPDFAAYIRRAHPFTDATYRTHLIAVWQAAARYLPSDQR